MNKCKLCDKISAEGTYSKKWDTFICEECFMNIKAKRLLEETEDEE